MIENYRWQVYCWERFEPEVTRKTITSNPEPLKLFAGYSRASEVKGNVLLRIYSNNKPEVIVL